MSTPIQTIPETIKKNTFVKDSVLVLVPSSQQNAYLACSELGLVRTQTLILLFTLPFNKHKCLLYLLSQNKAAFAF